MTTTLDKTTLRALTAELNAAVQAIAAKHGLTISIAGGTFTDSSATLKCQIACGGSDGDSVSTIKARAAWATYCHLYGFTPAQIGACFKRADGKAYEVVGLMPNRPKFPILVKGADGKSILLTADEVGRRLGLIAA